MNTKAGLLTTAILCITVVWSYAQSVSAGNETHIEQVVNKNDNSVLQLQSVAEPYVIASLNLEKFDDQIDVNRDKLGDQIRYNFNFQKVRPGKSFEDHNDVSGKEIIVNELRDFESKTDDEQVEAFRKIFEAVMEEKRAEEIEKENIKKPELDFNRMILDETRTNTGREFFDQFYTKWKQPKDTGSISLQVSEKISPGSGTIITVNINQIEVFNIRLLPGKDQIERAVNVAINQAQRALEAKTENFAIY